jgi:hypothetical protein
MVFRPVGLIATALIGLGISTGQGHAQSYPYPRSSVYPRTFAISSISPL